MRRAVPVVRQRCALARRPAAGRRAALQPLRDRIGGEVVPCERHVVVADLVDPQLRRHREVDPDVVEQRLGRLGEVVPVRGEALYAALAGAQDALVVREIVVLRPVLKNVRSKLAIDGSAEVVHRCLPGTALYGGGPLRGPVAASLPQLWKLQTSRMLTSR